MIDKTQLYPGLFQPGRIGGLRLRNRAIMGIYPTRYATASQVTDRLVRFYRARSKGGAALIVVEGPCLDFPRDYRGGAQLRIDEDAFLPGLLRLTRAIHGEGARAFLHLNYPAQIGSAEARVRLYERANAAELGRIIRTFGDAAGRAREAGFDGVEVQAGWGELVSRLLSPVYNHRTDEYGGFLVNRARFLLGVVKAIQKSAGPEFPIQVKLSVREFLPEGFDVEEAQAVAAMLEKEGVASILVSAGTADTRRWSLPPQAAPPAPLAPLAAQIKEAVGIPIVAVGKIKGPDAAEAILASGQADFIAFTRPFIADPDWPAKARQNRPEDIRGCIYCLQDCSGSGVKGLGRACTVNPYTGREGVLRIRKSSKRKRVVVVGGGPAGMQAAITAAERGHEVIIFEQASYLGGVFAYPRIAGYKGDVAQLPRYLEHRVRELDIQVTLGVRATSSHIITQTPDAVVLATGSSRLVPPYPGIEGTNVVEARSLWAGGDFGRRVAIIGAGSVAFEAGDWLADRGRDVVILTRHAEFLRDMNELPRKELLDRLAAKAVKVMPKTQVVRIEADRIVYQEEDGQERSLPIDTVVVAAGAVRDPSLAEELQGKVPEVYLAGDCDQPGTGGMAIRSGLAVGMRI